MKIFTVLKLGLLSLIANLFALAANAQIELGIKSGFNISEFSAARFQPIDIGGNSQYIRNFPRKGIHAGLLLSVPLKKHWSLQPEAVFSEQGATGKPSNLYLVSATEVYQFNYINFPILLKYSWDAGWFAETGPQVGLLLNAEIAETVVGASSTSYYNVNNQYKSTDLGWAFGVGYLSPINLGFDLRYVLGLSNFSNGSPSSTEAAPVQEGSLKNSVVQIGVFYQFGKPRTQVEP
jgi:Outer membrane protein beta-barrel domain